MSIRALLALAIIVPVTLVGMLVQSVALLLRLPFARKVPVLYHRILCKMLGVRVHERGRRAALTPLLVTANHSSWLDIPVIGSLGTASFVAKSEIASWPLIGWLSKLQRSVFVDRSRKRDTARVNAEIAGRLAAGETMVLFAEGTSSDGNRVLPFRSALVGAVRDAVQAETHGAVHVQPLALVYTRLAGLPITRFQRPRVAWYGGMVLAPHLMGVLRAGAIDVEAVWGEPLAVGLTDDRKAVARELEERVRSAFSGTLLGRKPATPRPVTEPPSSRAYSQPVGDPVRQARAQHADPPAG